MIYLGKHYKSILKYEIKHFYFQKNMYLCNLEILLPIIYLWIIRQCRGAERFGYECKTFIAFTREGFFQHPKRKVV